MAKYKCGAIVKNVSKGAEKWYKLAGWKKLNDKADTEKTTTS